MKSFSVHFCGMNENLPIFVCEKQKKKKRGSLISPSLSTQNTALLSGSKHKPRAIKDPLPIQWPNPNETLSTPIQSAVQKRRLIVKLNGNWLTDAAGGSIQPLLTIIIIIITTVMRLIKCWFRSENGRSWFLANERCTCSSVHHSPVTVGRYNQAGARKCRCVNSELGSLEVSNGQLISCTRKPASAAATEFLIHRFLFQSFNVLTFSFIDCMTWLPVWDGKILNPVGEIQLIR